MRTIASDIYIIIAICIIMFIIPTISHHLSGIAAPDEIVKQYRTMYNELQNIENEKSRLKKQQKQTTGAELKQVNAQIDIADQQHETLQEQSYVITQSMMQYSCLTAIGISIICIISAMIISITPIQTGLLLGAINTLLYGYCMYAEYMGDITASLYLFAVFTLAIFGMWKYHTKNEQDFV